VKVWFGNIEKYIQMTDKSHELIKENLLQIGTK